MSLQELPHLLPQNRKLRHLRGIYLRNLIFSRPRGHTIDDVAINKGPSKLDALRQNHQLHHTRSSESLRPEQSRRRSSTLTNANANPSARQRILEIAFESRIADAFFSLHCEGSEEPVYISEVLDKAMNFNFHFFDLSELGPSIARSPLCTVKVWVRRHDSWSLLLEDEVDLRSLNYIGSLQGNHFPPNSIVFHLTDGVYAIDLKSKTAPPKQGPTLATSSYNALMRLANLESSIQDALATQGELTAQINEILAKQTPNRVPEAEDAAQRVAKGVVQQKRLVKGAQKRRDELRESIQARRAAIASGRSLQELALDDVRHASTKLAASRELLGKARDGIHGQRRRICEDLTRIFPITPTLSAQPLSFQICGLPLPNTQYGPSLMDAATGEDVLSAALGHVALVTNMLQYYLGVALPYEITPFGSRSTIRDDISMLADGLREFPLYLPKGGSSAQYRFDYAWFLLNKDIETLCSAQNLRVVDIRDTLPNLKYLLYVCSAGSDELPERKKGGVRGLWAGRMHSRGVSLSADDGGSIADSRRGSADSEFLRKQRDEFRKSMKVNGAKGEEREGGDVSIGPASPTSTRGLPFEEGEAKLTLRTKGLRENAGK